MRALNITLVRHGEPQKLGLLLGHTDMPLSDYGKQQLRVSFKNLLFTRIISSPLKRCSEFAKLIAVNSHLELEIEDKIKEMDFGDWDGKTYESLWLEKPSIGDFWQKPHQISPPNGESLLQFQNRVNNWWEWLIEQNRQDVVVLTHAGVIKQVINNILNVDDKSPLATNVNIGYAGVVNIKVAFDESEKPWPTIQF